MKFGAVYAPGELKFTVKFCLNRQSNTDDREGPGRRSYNNLSLY